MWVEFLHIKYCFIRFGASLYDWMWLNDWRRGGREKKRQEEVREKKVVGIWERSAKSPAQCREKMQKEKNRELVRKDLLLGKGTVSFQAINKGTLWEHKEEGQ